MAIYFCSLNIRVLWGSFPWHLEWIRGRDQIVSGTRSDCWEYWRLLQWNIHLEVNYLNILSWWCDIDISNFLTLFFLFFVFSLFCSRIRHPNGITVLSSFWSLFLICSEFIWCLKELYYFIQLYCSLALVQNLLAFPW